jgi:hypothetical protein
MRFRLQWGFIALLEAAQEVAEVAAGVAPVDRFGDLLPVGLDLMIRSSSSVRLVKWRGVSALRLQNREVDLDLV